MRYIYHKIALSLLLTLALSTGCKRETEELSFQKQSTEKITEGVVSKDMVPGEAIIKLKSESSTSPSELRSILSSQLRSLTDEVELEPIFEIGGEYEALQREAGLHLWLKVKFDPKANLQQTISKLQEDDRIEVAQGNITVKPAEATYTPVSTLRASGSYTYNSGFKNYSDPLLPYQWHYRNEGSTQDPLMKEGADINLFNAWEIETGKPNVVVAIIDSGIEGTHEDLKESLWNNPEQPGTYGYNFCEDTYNIVAGFHGTHVAGTIAARNNNGMGVSGIAGGNGSANSGVRLMSIQIFGKDISTEGEKVENAKVSDIAKGFQWATEHGATLANCSWGFNDHTVNHDYPVLKKAIEYFINNAGIDPATKAQKADAPMKGGVVIFASGNESQRNNLIYPGAYDFVIAVASFGPNMKMADYSNIGDWIDIMAPGGDINGNRDPEHGVLSTISSTFQYMPIPGTLWSGRDFLFRGDYRYALQQGTSMATPHVTGVAALVLSKFGGQGYTNKQLRERLLSSVKQLDVKALHDRRYRDWLGSGYIDAARALEENTKVAPVMTALTLKEVSYQQATISWLPAKDEDASDKLADKYTIILTSGGTELLKETINNYGHKMGTAIEHTFAELQDGTKYKVEVVAEDRWGNKSSKVTEFETKKNNAPEITNFPTSLPLQFSKSLAFKSLFLKVKDAEGHKWRLKENIDISGVKVTVKEEGIDLLFLISKIELGDYSLSLKLEDEFGKVSTTVLPYKVVAYQPIQQTADFGLINMNRYSEPLQIELVDKFISPSGLPLKFAVKVTDSEIITARLLPGTTKLEIIPKKVGSTMVQVIVSDGAKDFTSGFTVNVIGSTEEAREAGGTFILYPIPTEGVLNIQTDGDTALPREIIITSLRGELVHRQYIDRDKDGISHVNLEKLTPGVYRVHLGKTVRTIVKK